MFSQVTFAILLAFAQSALGEGINCNGSFLAEEGALSGNIDALKATDLSKTYGQGEQITCWATDDTKAAGHGTCVFYQNVGDRTFTGQQTLDWLYQLGDHGCDAAGSIPTDPGNDVTKGEVTLNYVDKAAPANARRSVISRIDAKQRRSASEALAMSKREGINCHGSGLCTTNVPGASASLQEIYDAVNVRSGGDWGEGEHIACTVFGVGQLCGFYQNVGDRRFDKDTTVGFLQGLLDHNCGICGSIPTDPGNNVANGELTVNYIAP